MEQSSPPEPPAAFMHPVPWWWSGAAPYAVGPFVAVDTNNPGDVRIGACLALHLDEDAASGRTATYQSELWAYEFPDPLLEVRCDTIRLSGTVTLRPFTDEDVPWYAGWRDGVPGWAVALYMIGSTNAIGDDGDRWLDEIAAGGNPGSGVDPDEQPGDWVYPRR